MLIGSRREVVCEVLAVGGRRDGELALDGQVQHVSSIQENMRGGVRALYALSPNAPMRRYVGHTNIAVVV